MKDPEERVDTGETATPEEVSLSSTRRLSAPGRIAAFGEQRRVMSRRFGAQAYCDDVRVADGPITRIDVRPDWAAIDRISVAVVTLPLRPVRRATGRALQLAAEPVQVVRDGVPFDREVTTWTWYADDRVRWRLRP